MTLQIEHNRLYLVIERKDNFSFGDEGNVEVALAESDAQGNIFFLFFGDEERYSPGGFFVLQQVYVMMGDNEFLGVSDD